MRADCRCVTECLRSTLTPSVGWFLDRGRGRLCCSPALSASPLKPALLTCASTAAEAIAARTFVLGSFGSRNVIVPCSEPSSELGVEERFNPDKGSLKLDEACQSLLLRLLPACWSQECEGDMCMGLPGAEKAVASARQGAEAAGVVGAKNAERSGRVVKSAAEFAGDGARFLASLCAAAVTRVWWESCCARPPAREDL